MEATEELPAHRRAARSPWAATGWARGSERVASAPFYAAHDDASERTVAVKVIPAAGPARSARSGRPSRRRGWTTRDRGPVRRGEDAAHRYLVSELVEGRTLAQLEADDALSDRDVLRIGLALADALDHAHERGVIHRDVSRRT